MGLKLFGANGIDQKSNDLLMDPLSLIDSRNIRYSSNKEYEKRDGSAVDLDFSGDTYSDVWFIKSTGEYFFRSGTNYFAYKKSGATWVKRQLPIGALNPTNVNVSNMSGAEYLDSFIFTHVSGQVGTFKYDGNSVYLAGLPVPVSSVPTQSGTAFNGFMLNYFSFVDNNGVEVFGPKLITPTTNITQTMSFNTFKNSGFRESFLSIPTSTFTIDSANRTITYSTASLNVVVGAKVTFRSLLSSSFNGLPVSIVITNTTGQSVAGGFFFLQLEVEAITPTQITFTAESIKTYSLAIVNGGGVANIDCSLCIKTYFSVEEFTGYSNDGLGGDSIYRVIDNSALTTIAFPSTGLLTTDNNILLSNDYLVTTSKLRPPKCKYIAVYGQQLVFGNVLSIWDFKNNESAYTNNSLVMYSDDSSSGSGDLGENITASNRQLIGNTYDGEISGLARVLDSLIIFKTNSIYAIDGFLAPEEYSLRKIETDQIGCLSEKSIIVASNTVLFHGQDGIYAVSGINAKVASSKIETFMATTEPLLTRSVLDVNNNSVLFFTDMGVAVFNYEYKEWFIWSGISGNDGVTVNNDKEIKLFNSSLCTELIAAKNDSGVAINAYIKTAWLTLNEPSLLKKITDIRFFSLKNYGQKLSAQIFHDWDNNKFKDIFEIDMSDISVKTVLRKVDIQQALSISLTIGNNVVDEDMALSGMELTIGVIQKKDKNVE